ASADQANSLDGSNFRQGRHLLASEAMRLAQSVSLPSTLQLKDSCHSDSIDKGRSGSTAAVRTQLLRSQVDQSRLRGGLLCRANFCHEHVQQLAKVSGSLDDLISR